MRNKMIAPVAVAFALSSVGLTPYAASAYPSPSQMHKDSEIKSPVAADKAVSKDMAKDAKKKQHRARNDAKVASNKAHKAEKAAGVPGPDSGVSQ